LGRPLHGRNDGSCSVQCNVSTTRWAVFRYRTQDEVYQTERQRKRENRKSERKEDGFSDSRRDLIHRRPRERKRERKKASVTMSSCLLVLPQGTAYTRLDNIDAAIEAYNKALLENYSDKTRALLKKLEAKKKVPREEDGVEEIKPGNTPRCALLRKAGG